MFPQQVFTFSPDRPSTPGKPLAPCHVIKNTKLEPVGKLFGVRKQIRYESRFRNARPSLLFVREHLSALCCLYHPGQRKYLLFTRSNARACRVARACCHNLLAPQKKAWSVHWLVTVYSWTQNVRKTHTHRQNWETFDQDTQWSRHNLLFVLGLGILRSKLSFGIIYLSLLGIW